jgi:small GTP-binding protein
MEELRPKPKPKPKPEHGARRVATDLATYEQQKFRLAKVLRAAALLVPSDEPALRERARELFARLASDRFNVVVLGRFNRGKTSLMNAIVGTDRLPTGVVPVTSAITTVAYGSEERVFLRYEGERIPQEIRLDSLPDYISQRTNPGNIRNVKTVEVYLPAEILRRGLFLVDTPGLGSAVAANTRTTEQFFPEADAVLLVTSYESPLSDEEVRLLERAASSGRSMFVALNKQDTVSAVERAEILAYVEERLGTIFATQAPPLFPVSARDGLAGKLEKRADLVEASGVPNLEAALLRFLLAEKERTIIALAAERVVDLIQLLPSCPETLVLLAELRDAPPGEEVACKAASSLQVKRCEACERVGNVMFDFFRRHQYAVTRDSDEQRSHAQRHGFCNVHTWQYESLASARGIALAYPAVLRPISTALAECATPDATVDAVRERLGDLEPSESRCLACAVGIRAEADALVTLIARATVAGDDTAARLPAFCLPHVRAALGAVRDSALARALVEREAQVLQRLAEDLQRFALRQDALQRQLVSAEEERAPRQALAVLAGEKHNVFATGTGGGARGSGR